MILLKESEVRQVSRNYASYVVILGRIKNCGIGVYAVGAGRMLCVQDMILLTIIVVDFVRKT